MILRILRHYNFEHIKKFSDSPDWRAHLYELLDAFKQYITFHRNSFKSALKDQRKAIQQG